MNKLKKFAVATLLVLGLTSAATALPIIQGTIDFTLGNVTLNGNTSGGAGSATAITSFGGTTVVNPSVAPTGAYAGTEWTPVTFLASGFQFAPALNPNPVVDLWTFDFNSKTYSFALTSVSHNFSLGALNLAGMGVLSITGYEDTLGTWSFSTTGSGPTTFGFVAGNVAVPDGSTTAALLGFALVGLSLAARRRVSA
jgi:hypothetical protein